MKQIHLEISIVYACYFGLLGSLSNPGERTSYQQTDTRLLASLPQGSHASLKVLKFFSSKFKALKVLKTGQVLESRLISFHRSLKVLEFTKSNCMISATSNFVKQHLYRSGMHILYLLASYIA